jgi:uncharacterized protein YjdB
MIKGMINMNVRRMAAVAVAALFAIVTAACSDDSTPTIASSASTVSSIAVAGTPPAIGGTSQFTATATLSTGTTQDVTSLATWTSSNTGTATVASTGIVTGIAAGTATIQATYQNVTGSDQITLQ